MGCTPKTKAPAIIWKCSKSAHSRDETNLYFSSYLRRFLHFQHYQIKDCCTIQIKALLLFESATTQAAWASDSLTVDLAPPITNNKVNCRKCRNSAFFSAVDLLLYSIGSLSINISSYDLPAVVRTELLHCPELCRDWFLSLHTCWVPCITGYS